ILGAPFLGLVCCRWVIFAHRTRSNDVPYGHDTLLDETGDDRFGAVFAQLLVHDCVAARVGEPLDLDDVTGKTDCGLRQPFELLLILRRDYGAARIEPYNCLALYVIIAELGKTLGVLPDVLDVRSYLLFRGV